MSLYQTTPVWFTHPSPSALNSLPLPQLQTPPPVIPLLRCLQCDHQLHAPAAMSSLLIDCVLLELWAGINPFPLTWLWPGTLSHQCIKYLRRHWTRMMESLTVADRSSPLYHHPHCGHGEDAGLRRKVRSQWFWTEERQYSSPVRGFAFDGFFYQG